MRHLHEMLRDAANGRASLLPEDEIAELLKFADKLEATAHNAPHSTGILGGSGPYAHDSYIDTSKAILLGDFTVALTTMSDGRRRAILQLGGRINRTPDQGSAVIVVDPDGLASITSQITGLMQRAGISDRPFAQDYLARYTVRMGEMP